MKNHYRAALDNASDCLEFDDDFLVRIERYKTKDIRLLIEEIWDWSCTLKAIEERGDSFNEEDDIKRIKKIIRLQNKGIVWPYVSYWADNMQELSHVDIQPDGDISVPNHGDGWHRIVACVERKAPTIEILFLEGPK